MRVQPITCYRPAPHAAETFAALPYDVFNRAEAAAYVADHPGSFLAIDRPETAFGPDQDMYAPEVYAKAGELIRAKAYEGTLLKDTTPCFYLYRLEMDGRSQIGVVAACSVAEYEDGIIKRHEKTRPNKTADRVQHIRATGAQTGPVFLTYRDNAAIDIIVSVARSASPLYDFTDEQGVRQTIWRVARPVAVDALVDAFSLVPCAYIADGHHRASAAAQVAHDLRAEAGDPDDELPSDMFLAVLFPASQLYVMPYNRVVVDTAGLDEDALLDAIAQAGFEVGAAQTEPVEPDEARRFGLYAFGAGTTFATWARPPMPAWTLPDRSMSPSYRSACSSPSWASTTRAPASASSSSAASKARPASSGAPGPMASPSRCAPPRWTS